MHRNSSSNTLSPQINGVAAEAVVSKQWLLSRTRTRRRAQWTSRKSPGESGSLRLLESTSLVRCSHAAKQSGPGAFERGLAARPGMPPNVLIRHCATELPQLGTSGLGCATPNMQPRFTRGRRLDQRGAQRSSLNRQSRQSLSVGILHFGCRYISRPFLRRNRECVRAVQHHIRQLATAGTRVRLAAQGLQQACGDAWPAAMSPRGNCFAREDSGRVTSAKMSLRLSIRCNTAGITPAAPQ